LEKTQTSPSYRIYVLEQPATILQGLIRDEDEGKTIEVEVKTMPASEFGSFVAHITYPSVIGKVELDGGRWVGGFICKAALVKALLRLRTGALGANLLPQILDSVIGLGVRRRNHYDNRETD